MGATIFFLLFLLLIPRAFKKAGVYCWVKKKYKKASFMIVVGTILGWLTLLQCLFIWIPSSYRIYLWILIGIGWLLHLFRERKYFSSLRDEKTKSI